MKLLYTVNSPYARKVRIVAAEKHIEIELELVILADLDCPVKQYSPLSKVPVLILDDGDSLYDSRVIVEYLDYRTPLAQLLPQDHHAKIYVRRWEALADGMCDAAVAVMMEQRKESPNAKWIAKQMGKVLSGLQTLNDDLAENKWCVNNAFSLADIAVGCTLGYLDLRFANQFDFPNSYPNLHKLQTALLNRESFKNSLPMA